MDDMIVKYGIDADPVVHDLNLEDRVCLKGNAALVYVMDHSPPPIRKEISDRCAEVIAFILNDLPNRGEISRGKLTPEATRRLVNLTILLERPRYYVPPGPRTTHDPATPGMGLNFYYQPSDETEHATLVYSLVLEVSPDRTLFTRVHINSRTPHPTYAFMNERPVYMPNPSTVVQLRSKGRLH